MLIDNALERGFRQYRNGGFKTGLKLYLSAEQLPPT